MYWLDIVYILWNLHLATQIRIQGCIRLPTRILSHCIEYLDIDHTHKNNLRYPLDPSDDRYHLQDNPRNVWHPVLLETSHLHTVCKSSVQYHHCKCPRRMGYKTPEHKYQNMFQLDNLSKQLLVSQAHIFRHHIVCSGVFLWTKNIQPYIHSLYLNCCRMENCHLHTVYMFLLPSHRCLVHIACSSTKGTR